MTYAILGILIAIVVYTPTLWVRYVMWRHSTAIDGMPGTGAELAEHLVDTLDLAPVRVEQTEPNCDHYDPQERVVRLSPQNFGGKSLTAIAVAVHEVGHALQHKDGDRMLELRTRMAPTVHRIEQIAILVLTLVPVITLLTRLPVAGILMLGAGLSFLAARIVFHALTLPVEFDASFNKALPIIERGQYVAPHEQVAVRRVLRAAAMTYVAGALADMLSVWRWLIILRRG